MDIAPVVDYLSRNYIELLGFLFGIIYVILAIKENAWCWVAGIVNVTMYIIVFFDSRLYGMMSLQVIYLVMSIYGLVLWMGWFRKGRAKPKPAIRRVRKTESWIIFSFIAGATLLIGIMLAGTDNQIPYWDGLITSFGLAATWMTARKILDNWLVWIVNDVTCVIIYAFIGLYLTMAFYLLLAIMAVVGYREWKRSMLKEEA